MDNIFLLTFVIVILLGLFFARHITINITNNFKENENK